MMKGDQRLTQSFNRGMKLMYCMKLIFLNIDEMYGSPIVLL